MDEAAGNGLGEQARRTLTVLSSADDQDVPRLVHSEEVGRQLQPLIGLFDIDQVQTSAISSHLADELLHVLALGLGAEVHFVQLVILERHQRDAFTLHAARPPDPRN